MHGDSGLFYLATKYAILQLTLAGKVENPEVICLLPTPRMPLLLRLVTFQ